MRRFKYKAKDKDGQLVIGEVEAANEQHAAKLVRDKDLILITLKPIRELPFNFGKKMGRKVTSSDVTTLTRQLATMVNAGLPLTESLLILRTQARGPFQKIIAKILADVEEGEPLSSAMSKHPNIFSKSYYALIKAGELGGVLDEVLARLADNLEKEQEFKGKVKGALIYPFIIIIGIVIVAFVMMIFVIPRLTTLYEQFDADLPLPTVVLIAVSTFMTKFWPLIIAGFGFSVYGLKLYRATKAGRKRIDTILFKIPIYGDLSRQIVLTDTTRTLSLMVGSGVSIIEALNISAEVVGNVIVTEALVDCSKMVEKGFPVAFAFSRHPEAFPYILSQMVAVGEETGKMDEVLQKVSHVFEVESDQKVKALTAAVEPIILILLGVGVAFLVISVILPIYNLTTQF
jgi:type IV pilus assembly protein PilC